MTPPRPSLALESLHGLRSCLGALALALGLSACGGGGGGGTTTTVATAPTPANASSAATGPVAAAANVLTITVDKGIDNTAINAPFVTVRVCQPGSTTCVDVDHVLVDTGSNGLRLSASALPAGFLPTVTDAGGTPVGECSRFASGYAWGPVRKADIGLAASTAAGISVHVVDDPQFAPVPASCNTGIPNLGVGAGARGILGIGLFAQDCGTSCEASAAPAVYFSCNGAACVATRMPLAGQVTNPVAALPADNNGVVLVMPAVPEGGFATLAGSLILGIGTQPNNAFANATVYPTNAQGFVSVVYRGTTFPNSFLDSGSNGVFVNDPTLQRCGDFYCPGAQVTRQATVVAANGTTTTFDFPIDNVSVVSGQGAANLAGPTASTRAIDFGLPFFFGRTVYVARSGAATPAGTGPYWAW